ncbi:MAG: hypothetical protein DWQ07_22065 [Chloroflexi bacterium]|nr:MAG: hypothetical protein DWQ07_22065 [Chloroflexota bacterium]MBL1196359.1 hypothetical protein [Chloroflexota bacterium]NOH13654.1 hypothetical protein [Chloroflexota bacterium]
MSIASEEQIAILNNEAARVAYLVDGDEGGDSIRGKILRAGISEEKITSYTSSETEEFVLEDFIDPELYCVAANNQLTKWNEKPNLISPDMLPVNNRPKWLEDFCKEQGFSVPSKPDIAYEILDNSIGKTIITKKYSKFLKSIYTKIESIINSKIDEV